MSSESYMISPIYKILETTNISPKWSFLIPVYQDTEFEKKGYKSSKYFLEWRRGWRGNFRISGKLAMTRCSDLVAWMMPVETLTWRTAAARARETLEEVRAGKCAGHLSEILPSRELAVSPIEKRSMKSEMRSSPDHGIIASRFYRKRAGSTMTRSRNTWARNCVFFFSPLAYLWNNAEATTLKDVGLRREEEPGIK